MTIQLSPDEKTSLLEIAHRAISARFSTTLQPPDISDLAQTPVLTGIHPCFVTLRKDDRLRGCIGNLESNRPLFESVMANAVKAAFEDRRFQPLTHNELAELDIEISVLTPAIAIKHVQQIELGRHGVILQKNIYRAVFLPEVPLQFNWNREELLQHLCRKAGLAPDEWKKNTDLSVFEALKICHE